MNCAGNSENSFNFLRGNPWKSWNKDARVDFTSLKMHRERVLCANSKIANWEPTIRVTWSSDTWWCMVIWKIKSAIYLWQTARSMATKLGKLVAYVEVKGPKKLHFRLTSWSQKVTWQNKKKYLFLQNMYDHRTLQGADVWSEVHNKFIRLWSRDHKKSRVKLKT